MNHDDVRTPQTWEQLLAWREDFPAIIHKWLDVIVRLIAHTKVRDNDELGDLIIGFMLSSHIDINDLMTLTHTDSHHGAQYFLRALFERTVTLKYLSQNPGRVGTFKEYDAVDWDQILKGIQDLTGMTVGDPARANIARKANEARVRNKQERCPVCKNQRPTAWTTLNTKDMADRVGMGHLYLNSYLMPSKLMHPTLWGTRDRIRPESPMYNTLNGLHYLIIETILVHRRHFIGKQFVTPIMGNAVLDFLRVWVFSDTSFDGVLARGEKRDGKQIYYGFR
jgi:hypothetical protein